jgi:hypothetical protein
VISRRPLNLLATLLLPLLALRALLPVGYMAVMQDSGLRVVMCSEGLQLQRAAEAGSASHGHELPADHGDGGCAFALAAFSAPPPAPLVFALPSATTYFQPADPTALPVATAVRRPSARAPPRAI